jgi:hypothetical protein
MTESHFDNVLDYIENRRGKLLTIFSVCNCDESTTIQIESALSSHVCVETIRIGLPSAEELTEIVDAEFMKPKGFILSKGAKKRMTESLKRLSGEANFNGHKSIKQFAEGIIRNILKSNNCVPLITSDLLEICGKISEQESLVKTRNGIKRNCTARPIGFTHETFIR